MGGSSGRVDRECSRKRGQCMQRPAGGGQGPSGSLKGTCVTTHWERFYGYWQLEVAKKEEFSWSPRQKS